MASDESADREAFDQIVSGYPQPPDAGANDQAGQSAITALLVPADMSLPTQHVKVPTGPGEFSYLQELDRLLGGTAGRAQWDRNALVYTEEHAATQAAPNPRLTNYVLRYSEAAEQFSESDPSYTVHGDAVIVGQTDDGQLAELPQRIVLIFVLASLWPGVV